jgi:hypothetical protein
MKTSSPRATVRSFVKKTHWVTSRNINILFNGYYKHTGSALARTRLKKLTQVKSEPFKSFKKGKYTIFYQGEKPVIKNIELESFARDMAASAVFQNPKTRIILVDGGMIIR